MFAPLLPEDRVCCCMSWATWMLNIEVNCF